MLPSSVKKKFQARVSFPLVLHWAVIYSLLYFQACNVDFKNNLPPTTWIMSPFPRLEKSPASSVAAIK